MNSECKPKFNLGQVVATPDALDALNESGQSPDFFLARHAKGDWGEICEEDNRVLPAVALHNDRFASQCHLLIRPAQAVA